MRIAGVDEAGRGALAGPLVAASVILPEGFDVEEIRDSKRRTPRQRREAFERIVEGAEYRMCWAQPLEVDRRGIHACNLGLLREAARQLEPSPDFVLIDGIVPPPDMELSL
jgi:ribonuclease HII